MPKERQQVANTRQAPSGLNSPPVARLEDELVQCKLMLLLVLGHKTAFV